MRLIFTLVLLLSFPALADDAGPARVIDGDTIAIGKVRIRFHRIDAPEIRQNCLDGRKQWPCGREATVALTGLIGTKEIRCVKRDVDRYKRIVAVCYLGDLDLSTWMVRHGWAVAYRRYSVEYGSQEDAAKADGVGVWRGQFTLPWEWWWHYR
jgi:endonuclease YncB( thermonuclease family)